MLQLSDEGPDSAKIMRIVNHPIRMRIIELLATRPMSWKDLSTELGVRTGSLYHHLDTLEKIVARDSERRYTLTRLGRDIYAELNDGKKTPAQSMQGIEKAMKRRTLGATVREIFVPRALIVPLTSTRSRGVASLAGFSAFILGLLLVSRNQLVLFSFSPTSSLFLSVSTYLISLIVITATAYLAIALIFKERGDIVTILASTALSFVPLCLFGAGLHFLFPTASSASAVFPLTIFASSAAVTVMFAFFQAWGAGVVGAGMSVASGLRMEKTLMVSLVALYATLLIVLVQGGHLT